MTYYRISCDPQMAITVVVSPGTPGPSRDPDFPMVGLGANTSDWVDCLTRLFVNWVTLFHPSFIVAVVELDGTMRAWIEAP